MELVNSILFMLFTVCFCYQMIYIPISWLGKKEKTTAPQNNRYAVLICARNEATVIGELIDSINRQSYPRSLVSVFVMADNCDDDTAAVARAAGAEVFVRHNKTLVGKGYALSELLGAIDIDGFDGFFVFDADNILSRDYIEKMNVTFCQGHDIVTSYRNSKNYGDNWISAGYALWFMRESRYLNYPRHLLGFSCAVSGTGFMFSRAVAKDGWQYHMLTEDIQFSVDNIINGRNIAFCKDAELFDEQPTKFSQSWAQRMRWSKGFLQVFCGYGKRLVKGIFRGNFCCYDITMSIMPAFILSILSLLINAVYLFFEPCGALVSLVGALINTYATLFAVGAITTVTEWHHIHTTTAKKLLYTLTFPLFMATYLPVSIASLFCKVNWKPIKHNPATAEQKQFIK